jgi:hypothetical protein
MEDTTRGHWLYSRVDFNTRLRCVVPGVGGESPKFMIEKKSSVDDGVRIVFIPVLDAPVVLASHMIFYSSTYVRVW